MRIEYFYKEDAEIKKRMLEIERRYKREKKIFFIIWLLFSISLLTSILLIF